MEGFRDVEGHGDGEARGGVEGHGGGEGLNDVENLDGMEAHGENELDCEGTEISSQCETGFLGNFSKLGSFLRSRKRAAFLDDHDDEVVLRAAGEGVGRADDRAFLGAEDVMDEEARLVRQRDGLRLPHGGPRLPHGRGRDLRPPR